MQQNNDIKGTKRSGALPSTTLPHLKKDTVVLNDYMRSLLCEGVCSRLDIIVFLNEQAQISLLPDFTRDNLYTGLCPWCGAALNYRENTFFLNIKTGQCCCIRCRRDDDFISLLCEKRNLDFSEALCYLAVYMKNTVNAPITNQMNITED